MSTGTDSSETPNGAQKPKGLPKSRKLQARSSEDSDDRQISRGSRASQKSFQTVPQPTVTVLEQLSYKTSAAVDLYPSGEPPKRTATTHNSTTPTVITAVLRDLRDDIVRSSDYRQPGPVALVNGDRAIAVIGGDNVYVQSKTKFIPVPREKALSSHQNPHFWAYQASKLEEHSPVDIAVLVQKVFTPISSVCFGLLGGVALLQLILVDHLVGEVTSEDQTFFLQSYSRVAALTPLLFYILLAVCIVSVLDRVPLQGEIIVCQRSWVVVAVYVLTLVITLSCASYDDLITSYPQNKTMFQDQMKTVELVSNWRLMNTLRCLLAIVGWILFSLTTPSDLLLQHLLHIKQYEKEKQPSSTTTTDSLR